MHITGKILYELCKAGGSESYEDQAEVKGTLTSRSCKTVVHLKHAK